MKNIHYQCNMSSDIIEIKVRNLNKVIYRASCPISNKKRINEILSCLEYKGFIDLSGLKKIKERVEQRWFE